ncbi:MAG: hypothetical protein QW796_04410 [Thermoproteota archaeon]
METIMLTGPARRGDENTHLRERIKWLEEQLKGLPTRKYKVLKRHGFLQPGQVIEVCDIPWVEGLVGQGIWLPKITGKNAWRTETLKLNSIARRLEWL